METIRIKIAGHNTPFYSGATTGVTNQHVRLRVNNNYGVTTGGTTGGGVSQATFNYFTGITSYQQYRVITGNSYSISEIDNNYNLLFSYNGISKAVIKDEVNQIAVSIIKLSSSGVVKIVPTGGTSLLTAFGEDTIYDQYTAAALVYKDDTNKWYGFGGLGSGSTVTTGLGIATFTGYTASTSTAISNRLLISSFNGFSGTTVPALYQTKLIFNAYTGTTNTAISNRLLTATFNSYTGTTNTAINNRLLVSSFNTFSGTTVPALYQTKAIFNSYTGTTNTAINNRLLTSIFNSYTGTTAPATYASKTIFNSYTGTTVPATYANKTIFNIYTGATGTRLSNLETNYVSGATNLGTGSGVFSTKTSNKLNFKSLSGGTNIVLSATTNHIIVNALTGTDPELDFIEKSDFIFGGVGVTSGHVIDGWYVTSSGTGAGVGTDGTYVDSNENAVGVCAISVGTTSTGRCRLNTGANSFIFGKGHTFDVTFRATLDALSTTAQTYTTIIGFCDVSTAAAQSDGCYFRYTNATNSGRWQCVNENNTTENPIDSGVAPTPGQMDVFRIVVNAAGTSVLYYINGVLVATNNSQIPTSSGRNTALGCGIWKSVGNTERQLFVDYYRLRISRTTPR